MHLRGNTVLITGGASGIGLALAERFLNAGNEVIICGRRAEKLNEAKTMFSKLHVKVCDVADASEREALFNWVKSEFPECNILVNNAGIQQRVNLVNADKEWDHYRQEVSINLDAPVHLTMLFVPHMKTKKNAAIINISSGLAFSPGVWVPIYSGTKAALHSLTMSLRMQLASTDIKVIEVFPPAVNTDLGGAGLHTFGVPVGAFADSVFDGIKKGDLEIFYGGTEDRMNAGREEINQAAKQMWDNFLRNNPGFLD